MQNKTLSKRFSPKTVSCTMTKDFTMENKNRLHGLETNYFSMLNHC